jgi:hypothetical protein
MKDELKAYESLQRKIRKAFKSELKEDSYTETQRDILDVMLANAVRRSGGPDKVTLAQVQGVKEMLENEFGMATAEAEEWARSRGK